MARKRKSAKRSTGRRRSRRVSGIMPDKDALMLVAGAVAGLAVVGFVNDKLPSTWDGKTKAAVLAVGGILLANQKNRLIQGAGAGVAALGGYKLINAVSPGTLPAISGSPMIRYDGQVAGFNNFPNNPQRNTIAGFNNFPNNPQRNTIAGVRSRAAAGSGIS